MTEIEEVASEVRELQKSFKDPVVIGQLIYSVAEEKKSFNLVLKEIMARLERIEDRLQAMEKPTQENSEVMLSEMDEDIVKFVSLKPVAAKQVQTKFKYSGSNGASARLNNLVRSGVLEKKQVGRKVFFQLKSR